MTTLTSSLLDTVERFADRIAVHHDQRDWTYADIFQRASAIADWFSTRGLNHGERVGILLPNSAEYVASYYGILLAGGVVVSLNPDTTSRDLINTLGNCAATAVIYGPRGEPALREALPSLPSLKFSVGLSGAAPHAEPSLSLIWNNPEARPPAASIMPDDLAQIIYTSGTTGVPKGVMLSHRNLAANCTSIVRYLELTADDSAFVILPFFYSYGNSLLLTHVAAGGRLVIASDFTFWNRTLDFMQQQQVTGFSGVPSSYAMLLHKSDFATRRFPTLRYLTCAGGALAPALVQRLRSAHPLAQLFLMYGQTEASARISTLLPADLDRKAGSIGKGIPGVQLRVLDEQGQETTPGEIGEIVAAGENLMRGYWNAPEESAKVLRPEGLWTGDLGSVDEDGYVYVVGRKTDMIKSGAYRLHPQEIEETLLTIEGVAEAAVVGVPDDVLVEVPVAFVVRSPGCEAMTEHAIEKCCNASLPRYKRIHRVRCVESLPRTASGKIRRALLRNRASGDPPPNVGAVAIGRNERARLRECLDSLLTQFETVVYVDSGSSDGSFELAKSIGVNAIQLDMSTPFTAARARNAGLHALLQLDPQVEYVQFVDADCRLDSGWLDRALTEFKERADVAVVCGRRVERHPHRSLYIRLMDLEWNTPICDALSCGGDAMFRRAALLQVGCFNPEIIAGEEPELCLRLRRSGWKVSRIDAQMTLHDVAMIRFSQWWRRNLRTGYGSYELWQRTGANREALCGDDLQSCLLWGIVWPGMLAASCGMALRLPPAPGVAALTLLAAAWVLQAARISYGGFRRGLHFSDALAYGPLVMVGKLAQAYGCAVRLWRVRRRSQSTIIEYKAHAANAAERLR